MTFDHDLKATVRTIPDYPKPGILFRDITTLLADARAHFTARISTQTHLHPGQRIRLDVDPTRFHFFDPQSGERITA